MTSSAKIIFSVSWDANLAESRVQLFRYAGFTVRSAVGEADALASCDEKADLMVLCHSIPRDTKRLLIQEFRENHSAPVLSLLRPGESKLPEATHGVDAMEPVAVLTAVRDIFSNGS